MRKVVGCLNRKLLFPNTVKQPGLRVAGQISCQCPEHREVGKGGCSDQVQAWCVMFPPSWGWSPMWALSPVPSLQKRGYRMSFSQPKKGRICHKAALCISTLHLAQLPHGQQGSPNPAPKWQTLWGDGPSALQVLFRNHTGQYSWWFQHSWECWNVEGNRERPWKGPWVEITKNRLTGCKKSASFVHPNLEHNSSPEILQGQSELMITLKNRE